MLMNASIHRIFLMKLLGSEQLQNEEGRKLWEQTDGKKLPQE